MQTVLARSLADRLDHAARYALTLACGHVVHRTAVKATANRTHCEVCAQADDQRKAKAPPCRQPLGPPCIGCHAKPVRRRFGTVPPKRGWRIVAGVAWRWYCSEECSTRAMGEANGGRSTANDEGVKKMRANAAAKALERLTAACKGAMEPDGRVPVKAMIRVFMVERHRWYSLGYTAGYQRNRRLTTA